MSTLDTAKKSDWHPADVVAALRKAGWSLRRLSVAHGYNPSSLKRALTHSYPKAERIIAAAIGISAAEIWPERHAERARRKYSAQHSTPARKRGKTQSRGDA